MTYDVYMHFPVIAIMTLFVGAFCVTLAGKREKLRNVIACISVLVPLTLLSLLFVVMPSVQSFYQIMSQLTVVLYLIMYMLMFSAAIYLRYNMKKSNRPFRIGGKGNGMMWFIGGLGFLGSLLAFVLSFIPPSQISVGSNTVWFSVLIIGALVVVIAPFIIYASRKPSWTNKESQFEPFHWEETAAPTAQPQSKPTAPTTDPNAGTKGSTPPQP